MLKWTKIDNKPDDLGNIYWEAGSFVITKANTNSFFVSKRVRATTYICLGFRKTMKAAKNFAENYEKEKEN